MSKPRTLDHLRSKKKPYTKRVALICDSELADAFDAVVAERDERYDERRSFDFTGQEYPESLVRAIEDVEARYEALEPQVEESTEEFVFRGIGRRPYDDLLAGHPPTQTQIESNKAKGLRAPDYNPDSFPPALCAASCVSHEATFDEWKALLGDSERWNSAEELLLFQAALAANTDARVVDVGKGSAATRN